MAEVTVSDSEEQQLYPSPGAIRSNVWKYFGFRKVDNGPASKTTLDMTMMKVLSLVAVLIIASFNGYLANDEGEARLLASKNILNQYLVEEKDLTVEYKIYNIGGSAAQKVQLRDDSFPEADFAVVAGNLQAYWERITPNTNVTHSVILRPLSFGYFNFTAAEVSYSTNDDFEKRQVGYTSAPGEGGIVSFKDFNRRFSPHVLDWLVFAVMTLPSLGIPLLLWFSSKSKYDPSKPKKS